MFQLLRVITCCMYLQTAVCAFFATSYSKSSTNLPLHLNKELYINFVMSLTEWMSLKKLLKHACTFILTNFNYLNRRDKYEYAFSKKILLNGGFQN